jgi:hypothetical protein
MIEVKVHTGYRGNSGTKTLINPINLILKTSADPRDHHTAQLGETHYNIDRAVEVNTFPAIGDQRIWTIWFDEDTKKLDINQHRVLAYRVSHEIGSDVTSIKPIALGIQLENIERMDGFCVLLIDVDLKLAYDLSLESGLTFSVMEYSCDDILATIKGALKMPELTEKQLPEGLFKFSEDKVASTIETPAKKQSNGK